ncbi:MAG TPA: phosphate acetyltransferase, partial [Nocardioidaceae bacterium]|nr:phosphate acetyltransferase [Nocardioidaceae bacterium]
MTRTLLVVPTGPHVGLTSACLGLLRALDERGVRVGFVKPLAQPRSDGRAEASNELVAKLTSLHPPEALPAAVLEERLGSGGVDAVLEEVVARWQPLSDQHDVIVVEGLNPGPTQIYSSRLNQAMAKALDADVILVGACTGGGGYSHPAGEPAGASTWPDEVEHLAESLAITAGTYSAGENARVEGCIVTRVPHRQGAVADISAALERRRLSLFAAVAYNVHLTQPRVRDLVRDLQPRVLTEGDQSRRITDVSVFAQNIPGGLRVLTDGRLIVVPGDRHDVVMATCLAALNGTRLAALLLTVGIDPDPAVWELTRAAANTGLPILVTPEATYPTIMRVEHIDVDLSADDLDRAEAVMTHGAAAINDAAVEDLLAAPEARRLSPAAFRYRLTELAKAANKRIVLPEGTEPRTVRAAVECAERGIARPVLLGRPGEVEQVAKSLGLDLPATLEVVDPTRAAEQFVAPLAALRAHKGWTEEMARERLTDEITVGTMMLQTGQVDGLVAGAEHTTADTVRPALQIIGTEKGSRLVSSVFFMCLPDEVLVYGDCAINPQPTAEELADIAVQSAASARAFGIEPRVAMISFSTGESGSGEEVAKVVEATRLVRERVPDLAVDGPLQYDAATSTSVGASKRPGSAVAGRATVFVFPNLDSGNTTYKAVQRSADVISIGP